MEYENDINKVTTTAQSVLSSTDERFSSRILARQSTMGSCSSRIYYRASTEGVPFQWETRPGKAIGPRQEDALPPLSPPPAVLSMGMPKPNINLDDEPNKDKRWSRAWLVKKIKKRMEIRKVIGGSKRISNATGQSESARFSSSSFASTLSTTSSSDSSLSHCSVRKDSNKPFTCSPIGLNAVVVYFVKRS